MKKNKKLYDIVISYNFFFLIVNILFLVNKLNSFNDVKIIQHPIYFIGNILKSQLNSEVGNNNNNNKMKQKLLIALICISTSVFSQKQNLQSSNEVSSNFVRPGVVVTTMNFKGVDKLDLSNLSLPRKFDNFKISNNSSSLTIKSNGKKSVNDSYREEVKSYVSKISGQVLEQAMFIENNKINTEKLFNRSKYSMTEAQRNVINNLSGNLDKNATDLLLNPITDNNFVIVISPTDITKSTDKEGKTLYTGRIITSVYKVYLGNYENNLGEAVDIESQRTQFTQSIESSNIASIKFPIQEIYTTSPKGKTFASGSTLQEFYQNALDVSIYDASIGVDEFKTKAKVEDKMLIAIGSKEGLMIDDRYFSYETELTEDGEYILKRKGIDRVKKVGNTDVDLISNPQAAVERSLLYGDGGKKTRTGYIAIEAPELGIGVSAFFRQSPGVRIDYRIAKLAKLSGLNNKFIIPNLFLYAEAELITLESDNSYLGKRAGYVANVGLQKNINIGRMFALAPFAQYAVEGKLYDIDGGEVEVDAASLAAGLRAIVKFGPSIQLIPEFTYVLDAGGDDLYSSIPQIYEKSTYIGGALRFNF